MHLGMSVCTMYNYTYKRICNFPFECQIGLSDKCDIFGKEMMFAPLTDVDSKMDE